MAYKSKRYFAGYSRPGRKTPSAGLVARLRRARPAWGAEVVSSNIVGYQKVTLQPGFNFVAPQFTAVGGGDLNLQSIRLDVSDNDATGTDNIQILNAAGATVATYYWMPSDMVDSGVAGWVDGDDLADVELAPGQGVLLDTTTGVTISLPTAINE